MMRKTPVAARFLQRLVEVGDQICFSALRQWEFDETLAGLAAGRPNDLTPAVFASNPFSRKISRKIGDLVTFSRDAEQVTLKMGVIASVEHVLACLEELQSFRATISPSPPDQLSHDAEEEQLRMKVEAWSAITPTAGFFRTVGLLRVLRNHYAHLNASPHPALRAYVASHGTPLNRFWAKTPLDLHGLDFRTIATTPLRFELAIAMVNLLRVSVMNIDEMLAATLSFDDATAWVAAEAIRHPRSGQLSLTRLSEKVRSRLSQDFGHNCCADKVRPIVERLRAQRSPTDRRMCSRGGDNG